MINHTTSYLARRKAEIAQRIRLARRQTVWTQQQAADLLGCSRKRYNTIERGRGEFGVTEIDLLAEALSVPIQFFFEKPET